MACGGMCGHVHVRRRGWDHVAGQPSRWCLPRVLQMPACHTCNPGCADQLMRL